ncbi:hypothetical protein B9P99_00065 [Candidatus Marsarchaeota G1 archaeon OSP_B]|jgi:Ferredoxin subunits of nitrite reductase and ring-hydroxylating dioxygenases|uniref:Rieske domain-containing protein n=4 Tax=Candidatus Marsarchaeota group 1 TaxID=2203770 RepID=A0A2R6AHJ6_9ARCH|nr:MAG: hypothetical protein B9Q01_01625 [Candidatus Marsarchaeota G1 archaeon OSP_D]PSN85856.1 MAG: hypothetical protein B9Q02_04715 [Candidatus Marsarchaeota G1 archaeon BE_D]PSN89363.1 MAG: hypothetical protein B9Q00_01750 [Candidatus Marsarchaeota G1 archaeon OSP_C]PSN96932.1 MAG: hypothetical protein B9P99_00065 [Candidatus Marsarchaeota G1 archaeon OSP_B]
MQALNEFTPLCKVSEVPKNGIKAFRINGRHYVVVEHAGKYECLDGLCPHAQGLLAFGQVFKNYLYCSYHQAVFDLDSGKPLPGSPTDQALKKYEVKVVGDTIYAKIPR